MQAEQQGSLELTILVFVLKAVVASLQAFYHLSSPLRAFGLKEARSGRSNGPQIKWFRKLNGARRST
jgi:hypothetical protein